MPERTQDTAEQWLAESTPGILNGRLGEYAQVLEVLEQLKARTGLTVVSADPLSGTSAVIAAAADETRRCALVDARSCSDPLDLAMAVADAVVSEFHPKAHTWWSSGQPGVVGAGREGLELARDLAELEGFGADIQQLRFGGADAMGAFDSALRIAATRSREPVTIVIDHFGLAARSMTARELREVLERLRAVSQEAGNLSAILVEFPDGPAATALQDSGHPLYQFGGRLRMRRSSPEQIVESLMITRPLTDVWIPLLRAAAELGNGVPSITWRIVQLADRLPDAHTAAFAGWRKLRHYSEPSIARQWDMLRSVHPRAQWIAAAIALGRGPHEIPANPKSVQSALAAMRDLGLAWQPEPRRWALADPLLAAWTRDHAPPQIARITASNPY